MATPKLSVDEALVDATLIAAMPRIMAASVMQRQSGAGMVKWRLHTHFEVERHVPLRIDVTSNGGGEHDERAVLERTIESDRLYVQDRGYAKFTLFNAIVAKRSSYVCRLRDNSVFEVAEERPLTEADRAARVVSDQRPCCPVRCAAGSDSPRERPAASTAMNATTGPAGIAYTAAVQAAEDAYTAAMSAYSMAMMTAMMSGGTVTPLPVAPPFDPSTDSTYTSAVSAAQTASNAAMNAANSLYDSAVAAAQSTLDGALAPLSATYNDAIASHQTDYDDAVTAAGVDYDAAVEDAGTDYSTAADDAWDDLVSARETAANAFATASAGAAAAFTLAIAGNQSIYDGAAATAAATLQGTLATSQTAYDAAVAAADAAFVAAVSASPSAPMAVAVAGAVAGYWNALASAAGAKGDANAAAHDAEIHALDDAAAAQAKADAQAADTQSKAMTAAEEAQVDAAANAGGEYLKALDSAAAEEARAIDTAAADEGKAIDAAADDQMKADASAGKDYSQAAAPLNADYAKSVAHAKATRVGSLAAAAATASVATGNAYAAAMNTWASGSGDPSAIKQAAVQAADAARNAVFAPAYATYNGALANNKATWVDTVAPAYTTYSNDLSDHALTAYNIEIDAAKLEVDTEIDDAVDYDSTVIGLSQGEADAEIDDAVGWVTTVAGAAKSDADAITDDAEAAFEAEIDALDADSNTEADDQKTEVIADDVAGVQEIAAIAAAILSAVAQDYADYIAATAPSGTAAAASTSGTPPAGAAGTIDGMSRDGFIVSKIYPLMANIQTLQQQMNKSNDPAFKQYCATNIQIFQEMLAVEQAKLSVSPTSGTLPPTAPIDVSAAGRPGVYGIIPVYGSVANAVASFDEGDYLWTGLFTAQLVFLDLTLVSSGYRVAAGGYRFFFTARAVAGLLDDAANAALTGMRNNGGHAMRKLVGNLIPNSGRFADRLLVFKEIAGGILRNPEHVALWRTGADQGIGYLGTVGGKKVLVVVASEGPWAGKVISTIFPDANQLAIFLAR